jgi:hypothetical protein
MWKNYTFSSGICKKGTSSMHREMEKVLMCKIAWGEANLAIKILVHTKETHFYLTTH